MSYLSRQFFYSCAQGDKTFNFYITEQGKLIVECVHLGKVQSNLLIKNIPPEWQSGLFDESRKNTVKNVLENSFFTLEGNMVIMHVRGRGGWEDEIHLGYKFSDRQLKLPKPVVYLSPIAALAQMFSGKVNSVANAGSIDFFQFCEDDECIPNSSGIQGTFQWAKDIGFDNGKDLPAARIGYYVRHVDYKGGKRPIGDSQSQSWHFNRPQDPIYKNAAL